jgi:transposase
MSGDNALCSIPYLFHPEAWIAMMSEPGGKTYRPWEPQHYRQESHSPEGKLPEGDLVFFLLDSVPQLDLRRFYAPYERETRGAPPFDPALMVCLLLYAYCVGVFSSRKIALACERNLAFLAIVGSERPDFRTISDFRKLHLEAFKEVFVQVLRLAAESGLVKLGNVSTDGTKIQGNASRHKAMSYGYMKKEVERLREDIETLVTQAQQQDESDDAVLGSRRGDELPAELKRREDRLARIESAMRRLEAQAKAEADDECKRRAEAETERIHTGKPRRGKEPKPVEESPSDKAQSNFTDPELHIMPTSNKGWDYCGNAQASVDETCQIIVACDVTDASNDKQQAVPMAQATLVTLSQAGIEPARDDTGAAPAIVATLDSGYYSEAAVLALETLGFDPYIATGRQRHHDPEAPGLQEPASAQARMAAKVRRPEGKALYARRKVIVEPVFGQIKEARGFRRFLLRGLANIRGEWRLVCLTHNLLKIWRYGCGVHAL